MVVRPTDVARVCAMVLSLGSMPSISIAITMQGIDEKGLSIAAGWEGRTRTDGCTLQDLSSPDLVRLVGGDRVWIDGGEGVVGTTKEIFPSSSSGPTHPCQGAKQETWQHGNPTRGRERPLDPPQTTTHHPNRIPGFVSNTHRSHTKTTKRMETGRHPSRRKKSASVVVATRNRGIPYRRRPWNRPCVRLVQTNTVRRTRTTHENVEWPSHHTTTVGMQRRCEALHDERIADPDASAKQKDSLTHRRLACAPAAACVPTMRMHGRIVSRRRTWFRASSHLLDQTKRFATFRERSMAEEGDAPFLSCETARTRGMDRVWKRRRRRGKATMDRVDARPIDDSMRRMVASIDSIHRLDGAAWLPSLPNCERGRMRRCRRRCFEMRRRIVSMLGFSFHFREIRGVLHPHGDSLVMGRITWIPIHRSMPFLFVGSYPTRGSAIRSLSSVRSVGCRSFVILLSLSGYDEEPDPLRLMRFLPGKEKTTTSRFPFERGPCEGFKGGLWILDDASMRSGEEKRTSFPKTERIEVVTAEDRVDAVLPGSSLLLRSSQIHLSPRALLYTVRTIPVISWVGIEALYPLGSRGCYGFCFGRNGWIVDSVDPRWKGNRSFANRMVLRIPNTEASFSGLSLWWWTEAPGCICITRWNVCVSSFSFPIL